MTIDAAVLQALRESAGNLFFGFSRGGRELRGRGFERVRAHLAEPWLWCEPLPHAPGADVTIDVWTAAENGEWLFGVHARGCLESGNVIRIELKPEPALA